MTDETVQDDPTEIAGDQVTTTDAPASDESVQAPTGENTEPKLGDLLNEAIARADGKAPEAPVVKTPEELAAEDAAEADKGRLRGPDGKFRAMSDEEKKAHEAAKETAASADAGKKPDHVNDPIPKDINERTAERMGALVKDVKALQAVQKDHNDLMGYINSTGASPAEFSQALNYMRACKSNDPKVLEAAYEQLQGELLAVSERLGRPIPEVNLLRKAENADLVKEIQEGKLGVNRAHEIALWRSRTSREQTSRVATDTNTRQAQERAAVVQTGTNELNALETQLIQRDGAELYKLKNEIVFGALKDSFATLDPRQWKAVYSNMYESLKMQAPAAPAAAPPKQPTPLRPKAPAGGGGAKAPASALEAVTAALDGM